MAILHLSPLIQSDLCGCDHRRDHSYFCKRYPLRQRAGLCDQTYGLARNTDSGIEVRVQPMLVPQDHPLATVNDSYKRSVCEGDAVGDAMFYGRGAGEMPTASAIVGDVLTSCGISFSTVPEGSTAPAIRTSL